MDNIYNKLWVIDVEQFANFHSLCGIQVGTGKRVDFVIHESRDDRIAYLAWLKSCEGWITFNGINYDYPLVHNILTNKSFFIGNSLDRVVKWLFRKNNEIINSKNSVIHPSNVLIEQHDLFKINHYDRPQKSCSLKWLEFSLKWHHLEDLPFPPGSVIKKEHVQKIVDYNFNDVEATLMFWHYCKDQIDLRSDISATYGIDARNMSDTSIGKNILVKYYTKETGKEYDEFKDLTDKAYITTLKDVISDKIVFDTPQLKSVLTTLKNSSQNILSKKFKRRVIFAGVHYDMLKGGLHSHASAMKVESDDDYDLIDMDFGSYYPSLMLKLGIHPPQLGSEILSILDRLTKQRLAAKARGDKSTSASLKLTINSIYGLMGNVHSFMYSPTSMYKVTINGQLLLLMLIEKVFLEAGAECFYANTKYRWCFKTFLMRETGKVFIYQPEQVIDFGAKGNSGDMVKRIKNMSAIRSEVSHLRYVLNDHRKAA